MGESSREPGVFKCCLMCTRHCFEHHGNYGREETEQLVAAPSFSTIIKEGHLMGRAFLRVPVLFMEKNNYNVGRKLRLRGPHGFESECVVERHNDGYVLYSGYREFLAHHLIEPGDILTFILIAKQYYLVKMYGKFGEEKGLQTNVTPALAPGLILKSKHRSDVKAGSRSEGSGEEAVDRVLNLRQKSSVPGESDEEALDSSHNLSRKGKEPEVSSREVPEDFGEAFLSFDEANEEALARTHSLREKGKEPETPAATMDQSSGQKRKLPATPGAFRRGDDEFEREQVITTFITGANEKQEAAKRQRKAADELAASLGSPHQLVFICQSHVSHSITVYLSQLPLPTKSGIVTLIDEAGKNYSVLWIVQPDGRTRLARGWNVFISDHRIAVDDACLFVSTGKDVITVYIFRLADYYNPPKEKEQQNQDHRDDLQPSALEQSISEEPESLGGRSRGAAPSAGSRRPNTGEKSINSHGAGRTR